MDYFSTFVVFFVFVVVVGIVVFLAAESMSH